MLGPFAARHEHLYGGIPGRSAAEFAQEHAGKAWVAKIDIKDCFPNITDGHVRKTLVALGFSKQCARLISRLVTRGDESRPDYRFLPQGGATSTTIAHLVLRSVDRRIEPFARKRGLTYGRYVDDLLVSGDRAYEAVGAALASLRAEGFHHSKKKLAVMPNHRRQEGVGLKLNSRPTPGVDFQKSCWALIETARTATSEQLFDKLLRSLHGKLAHARRFESGFSKRFVHAIKNLKRPRQP